MVWINFDCINHTVPPGHFGGAICMCSKCCGKRIVKPKDAIEIMQEAQLQPKDDQQAGE